jgi:phosphohistidine phosphatase SixA
VTLVLIRHASAGQRAEWVGDDRRRPLDKQGKKQAKQIPALVADYEITRILSSPFDRCVQTVEPLARRRGVEIEVREELGEAHQLDEGVALVRSLLDADVAVCGHAGLSDMLVGTSQKKAAIFVLDDRGRLVERFRP